MNEVIAKVFEEEVSRGGSSRLRRPTPGDSVYKDQCAYSFDDAERSPAGLYTNLRTFISVGEPFLADDAKATGCPLYLQCSMRKVPRASSNGDVDSDEGKKTAALSDASKAKKVRHSHAEHIPTERPRRVLD